MRFLVLSWVPSQSLEFGSFLLPSVSNSVLIQCTEILLLDSLQLPLNYGMPKLDIPSFGDVTIRGHWHLRGWRGVRTP